MKRLLLLSWLILFPQTAYASTTVSNPVDDSYSVTATEIFLNPTSGGVVVNTNSAGMATGLAGIQVGPNWTNTATYAPPGGAYASNMLTTYGDGEGIISYNRTLNAGGTAQGVSAYVYANNAAYRGAWAFYGEAHRTTSLDGATGLELAAVNRHNSNQAVNARNTPTSADTVGIGISSGNGQPSSAYLEYSSAAAIIIQNNPGTGQTNLHGFGSGIVIRDDALDSSVYNPPEAISLSGGATNHAISWWSSGSNRAWKIHSNATSGTNDLALGNTYAAFSSGITAVGNVGIGTTSPTSNLQVGTNSTAYSGYPLLIANGSHVMFMYADTQSYLGSNGLLTLGGNGSTTTINLTSNAVGINTTTPATALDINGFMRMTKNSSAPQACAAGIDGAIALTHVYTLCICNGGSTTWVQSKDGTTACSW